VADDQNNKKQEWHISKGVTVAQIVSIIILGAAIFGWSTAREVKDAEQDVRIEYLTDEQRALRQDIRDIKRDIKEILERVQK
jgi:peptidoglycan hydrolase CwlO-like protein